MILLDTHILLWWQNKPELLSEKYRVILDSGREATAISTITCWEIVTLLQKGRVELPYPYLDWIRIAIDKSNIQLLDVNLDVVNEVFRLPTNFHNDPADRLIAATSITHRAKLATMDRELIAYPFLNIL